MNTNEISWIVVGVLVLLIGLVTSIATPMIKLTRTMTTLDVTIQNLIKQFNSFEINNHDDHKRIWTKNDEQDAELHDHETRISLLEHDKKGGV